MNSDTFAYRREKSLAYHYDLNNINFPSELSLSQLQNLVRVLRVSMALFKISSFLSVSLV